MKKRKNKAQQAVAAVVMGMNLVNTMSPLALAAQAPVQPEAMRPAPQAQPLEYTVLPQALQAVEGMVFARAEAAQNMTVSNGESGNLDSIGNGDWMSVLQGGTGIIGIMNGGSQNINSGGVGSVGIMNDGVQRISSGGTGIIDVMNSGSGAQYISNGGTGIIGTMNANFYQSIASGAYASIGIFNHSSGIQQVVGATGNIGTMNDGCQFGYAGGTCIIGTMEGGIQRGELAYIDTINNGLQEIYSSGVGSAGTMNGGIQEVGKSGTGIIGTMNGGTQTFLYDAGGSIGTMNNGKQAGAANMSIDVMNGGLQSNDGGSAYSANIGTMNGGSQVLTFAATGNIGVMNDGEQQINNSAVGIISSLNGGTQILNGDSATAKDTTINGGTQIIIGGAVSGNTVNAGVMLFENADATVDDVTMNGGEMLFGSANAYSIDTLNFNGGTVDLTENASTDYQTLKLENYSGSGGTFKLDADFAAENSDKVEINSATNAAGYIQVNGANIDASTISETNPLLLVTVSNGSATFTGKSLNGGGLYEYNPEIAEGSEINQDPNKFYLTGLTKNVNNDTLALLDGIDNSYAMWRNTNDTLRKRLGEIHTLPSNDGADGVWARYIGGKFDGGSYEGQYNLYQLGYDKNYDAKSIIGFALEKGGGNATYSFGSGEDDLFAGAVYGSWLADDGSYTDVVAKIGRFDTELNSYGDFPDSADYRHNAYSLSVEYGKKISLNKAGLYLEPQAQFIAGRLDSVNYTTDRGTKVSVDGINSYIGRVGVMFGQQLENGSDVYIKANLLHEFGGESSLAMLAANGDALTMEKDYGDTWYELGIGANIKIGRASYFYGDIERGFGGDIDKKWQINAGLRFEF